MEEILASIRKIIEDNDSAHPAVEESSRIAEVAPFPRPPFADRFAFDGGAEAGDADDEPPLAMSPDNLNRQPGLAASASGWDATAPRREVARPASVAPTNVGKQAVRGESGRTAPASGEAVARPKAALPELRPTLQETAAPKPAGLAPGPQAELQAPGAMSAKPSPGPAAEAAGRSIVSPTTIRQVSAAFDDLNHAVETETRRSFDEIAEDVLRPMLQEWLDDNLPRLVERLVREEIQRVARGTRG
jgi:hypothetical protein